MCKCLWLQGNQYVSVFDEKGNQYVSVFDYKET